MAIVRQESSDEEANVQMTSFMDLTFLLLIFFIVTASLKRPEKVLPVHPPQATYAKVLRVQNEVVVTVTKEGEWYLHDGKKNFNQAPVNRGDMMTFMRAVAEKDIQTPIRLDIDRMAPYGEVMPVIDNLAFFQLRNIYLKSQHAQADERPKAEAPKP